MPQLLEPNFSLNIFKSKLILMIVLKLFIFQEVSCQMCPLFQLALLSTEPVSREAHEAVPTQVLTSTTSKVGTGQNPCSPSVHIKAGIYGMYMVLHSIYTYF